ncbi:MAG: acetate kinase [Rikenellaceae bacterium]|nr:acetate kinase [Rikenellaceae bacterium]MBO5873993.1 acetate kinase [Rikenellaceae bacterium]
MTILVLNCGSSSIKYQVIDMNEVNNPQLLAKGLVERIGLAEGILTHKPVGKDKFELNQPIQDHTAGISLIIDAITNPTHGVIESLQALSAVGHRVAHGGEYFADSAVVNEDVIEKIKTCFELAPLHNPANLSGILAIEKLLPGIPQVAVFDTSFHQTIPAKNYLYALPYKYYENYRIRRYGFHGTSHKFVAKKACDMCGLDFEKSKVITCHIGNGASVTAILNGKSYDTSMGFTPVDGLIMGTRTGEIDPGALLYIADKENLSTAQINNLINKQSGMQGITDVSSDMRDIEAAAAEGNERALLGLDMYRTRIQRFVGGYAAIMGGVDLIVFTGGVGENDPATREQVCSGLEFMGVEFDCEANEGVRGKDKILSKDSSRVKVMVTTTDEELVIATDTFRLTGK